MLKGFFNVPKAVNEPVKSYAPGSPERAKVAETYGYICEGLVLVFRHIFKPRNVSRYNPKNDENEKNSNITFTLDSNELRKLYDEYILCEKHVKQTS